MEKHLVQIEFRYNDVTSDGYDTTSTNKTVTIGVYDTFDEACENGNKLLENLESKFELHQFPDGRYAKRDRFSKNGGCFGSKKDLVTKLAYLKTPFQFFASIKTLKHENVDSAIEDVVNSVNNYKKFKEREYED
jgi:hypothetical protein